MWAPPTRRPRWTTSKDAPCHYTFWAISLNECHIIPNYHVNSAYTLLRGEKLSDQAQQAGEQAQENADQAQQAGEQAQQAGEQAQENADQAQQAGEQAQQAGEQAQQATE